MISAKYGKVALLAALPICIFLTLYHSILRRKGYTLYENVDSSRTTREKAAFVILAKEEDMNSLRDTMQMLEDRFNKKYNYPYVFLNNGPFSSEFKTYTTGLASGKTYYGQLPQEMWSYPEWIDQQKAKSSRDKMDQEGVMYGSSESYRHMCRFQSGFFFRHPLLDQFEYYWRVEPHVKFNCDIDYDPFRVMKERKLKYGFAISLPEYENTIPTLWNTVKEFIRKYPQHIIPADSPDSMMSWISYDQGETYNLCHFWSNFEIASLSWLRSEAYLDYFNHLDKAGGFFYERWGDAPVHSIAAALMLKKSEVHYFYDMGYFHNPHKQCPSEPSWLAVEKCSCDPVDSNERTGWTCTPRFLETVGKKSTDFLITERKK